MADLEDHIPSKSLSLIAEGRKVALATVISTWGSAPRPIGSQLAITEDGAFFGSVSGGCVEGAVILEAQDCIASETCRILQFGVADEDAFAVGLACGGDIEIIVEPVGIGTGIDRSILEDLSQSYTERRPSGYQINTQTWERTSFETSNITLQKPQKIGEVYSHIQMPNPRLVIIGAVHISQHLSNMAQRAGFDVFINDPRDSFATPERFPSQIFLTGWSDEALDALGLDQFTAVVTLTHDPKIDTPALTCALKSQAFYIGALGSKRTHSKRLDTLQVEGFSQSEMARIHGPVGLDIAARTPAEIAVAILAEVIDALRKMNA